MATQFNPVGKPLASYVDSLQTLSKTLSRVDQFEEAVKTITSRPTPISNPEREELYAFAKDLLGEINALDETPNFKRDANLARSQMGQILIAIDTKCAEGNGQSEMEQNARKATALLIAKIEPLPKPAPALQNKQIAAMAVRSSVEPEGSGLAEGFLSFVSQLADQVLGRKIPTNLPV
ncbi:MAG: hypothetical protein JSS60_03880 [Verrucomicrobia bacterium]|nr:hypothetical protein [Verrucomicrobiota bacterium]